MKHNINITFGVQRFQNVPLVYHLRKCIRGALTAEGVDVPCEINVLITNNQGIQAINRSTREIDRPTDVLSFPMFDFTPGKLPENLSKLVDPETKQLPLGDMVISLERAKEQAHEYGHSLKREVGYLTIHSILHLLGYDHLDEGVMKKQMRAREEQILADIILPR